MPRPLAWTDAARLRQVLDGLLENALRVTPGRAADRAGRARRAGRPRVSSRSATAVPGLTDEDLAVAFERSVLYERYRGVRQVGTGLGLAIVHGLVTRLSATVEAGHAPEGGARFTIALPRRRQRAGRYFLTSTMPVAVIVEVPVPTTSTLSPVLTAPIVLAEPLPLLR